MGQAIGDVLPLAIGVAISPVPIIAIILMLGIASGDAASSSGEPRILDGMKTWMSDHNAAIMTVLLLVLGGKLAGEGIGGLSS